MMAGEEPRRSGLPTSVARTLMRFDLPWLPTATVSSAALSTAVRQMGGDSYVLSEPSAPYNGSATWTQNGLGQGWNGGSPGSAASNVVSMSGRRVNDVIRFDGLADDVQRYMRDPQQNKGLLLRQVSESLPAAHFDKNAELRVTYTAPDPEPTLAGPTRFSASPGGSDYTTKLNPTLSWLTAASAGRTAVEVKIFDGTNQIWTAATPVVATAGDRAAVAVPVDILNDSRSYSWRARTVIPLNPSAVSAWATGTLNVDASAARTGVGTCESLPGCHVANVDQTGASVLQAGQSKVVDLVAPAGVAWDDVDELLLQTNVASDGAGPLWIYDSSIQRPANPTQSLIAGAGQSQTLAISPPITGPRQVTIYNGTSGPATVTLRAYGWTEWSDDTPEPVDNPVVPDPADPEDVSEPAVEDGSADFEEDSQGFASTSTTDNPLVSEDRTAAPSPDSFQVTTPPSATKTILPDGGAEFCGSADGPVAQLEDGDVMTCVESMTSAEMQGIAALDESKMASEGLAPNYSAEELSRQAAVSAAASAQCQPSGTITKRVVWYVTSRFKSCMTRGQTLTRYEVRRGVRVKTGRMFIYISMENVLSNSSPTILQRLRLRYWKVSGLIPPPAYAVEATMKCEYGCSTDPIDSTNQFPGVSPINRDTGWLETLHTSNVTSRERMDAQTKTIFANTTWKKNPVFEIRGNAGIRCDKLRYLSISGGCVMTKFVPRFSLNRAGPYPESAYHIFYAQGTLNYPGATVPLNRHFWFYQKNLNRKEAKKRCDKYVRPEGADCDEYPFANSYQGCFDSGVCHVRFITSSDNRGSGGKISAFFSQYRIAEKDRFYVDTYYR